MTKEFCGVIKKNKLQIASINSSVFGMSAPDEGTHEHVRVVLRRGDISICRDFRVGSLAECLGCVQQAVQAFEQRFVDAPTAVVVMQKPAASAQSGTAGLKPGDVSIINMCGKITHGMTGAKVYNPGCVGGAVDTQDGFGTRRGVGTVYGNFMTSMKGHTTLFRAARRCGDILKAATLLFRDGAVLDIVLHMVVAVSVLPHAVVMSGRQIERALCSAEGWSARTVSVSEENVYMKPVRLTRGETVVLVHVYSNGTVFFFVTCDDMPVDEHVDLYFVGVCRELYRCIVAVC